MSSNPEFDRFYALRKLRFIVFPERRLETFGDTVVDYHLISELPDNPNRVRVREGRLVAERPLVITPHFADLEMDGFSDEARRYVEWLRDNEENFRILRYGYRLKSDNFSEQFISESLNVVSERVKQEVLASANGFSAVIQGEDEPWDVALIELWRRIVEASAQQNIRELQEKGKLF